MKLLVEFDRKFEDFYRHYQEKDGTLKYNEMIKNIQINKASSIEIYYEDLLDFSPYLARHLIENPEPIVEDAENALDNILRGYSKGEVKKGYVNFIPSEIVSDIIIPITELRAKHNAKLVGIKGNIIAKQRPKIQIKKACFKCQLCGATFKAKKTTARVQKPSRCITINCKARKSDFKYVKKENEYNRTQEILVQTLPNDIHCGQNRIKVNLNEDLMKIARKGTNVFIWGIYIILIKSRSDYESHIDAVGIKTI